MSIQKNLYFIALILVIIGGINWGLVGLFQFNLVATLFGSFSLISRLIYTLVGVSAIWIAIATVLYYPKLHWR